jgi:hypothetical protein
MSLQRIERRYLGQRSKSRSPCVGSNVNIPRYANIPDVSLCNRSLHGPHDRPGDAGLGRFELPAHENTAKSRAILLKADQIADALGLDDELLDGLLVGLTLQQSTYLRMAIAWRPQPERTFCHTHLAALPMAPHSRSTTTIWSAAALSVPLCSQADCKVHSQCKPPISAENFLDRNLAAVIS